MGSDTEVCAGPVMEEDLETATETARDEGDEEAGRRGRAGQSCSRVS